MSLRTWEEGEYICTFIFDARLKFNENVGELRALESGAHMFRKMIPLSLNLLSKKGIMEVSKPWALAVCSTTHFIR